MLYFYTCEVPPPCYHGLLHHTYVLDHGKLGTYEYTIDRDAKIVLIIANQVRRKYKTIMFVQLYFHRDC